MTRLTKLAELKDTVNNNKYEANVDWNDPLSIRLGSNKIYEITDKLGELEDIEEELGIDLITLFKALFYNGEFFFKVNEEIKYIKDGFYSVHILGDFSFEIFDDVEISFGNTDGIIGYYKFSDYGKTWALTREELQ